MRLEAQSLGVLMFIQRVRTGAKHGQPNTALAAQAESLIGDASRRALPLISLTSTISAASRGGNSSLQPSRCPANFESRAARRQLAAMAFLGSSSEEERGWE